MPPTSLSTEMSVSSSASPLASLKSSEESLRPVSIFSTLATVSSSERRSLPRSCAFFASSQTFGSSRTRVTSTSRDFLVS